MFQNEMSNKYTMEISATTKYGSNVTIIDFVTKYDKIYAVCIRSDTLVSYPIEDISIRG